MSHEIESSSDIIKSTLVDEKEMEEITEFFTEVESMKNKILKEDPVLKNNSNLFTRKEITNLLIQNLKLLNIISEDTIQIYVESFFKKNEHGKYELTEDSLEGFLTSIMIFSNNE